MLMKGPFFLGYMFIILLLRWQLGVHDLCLMSYPLGYRALEHSPGLTAVPGERATRVLHRLGELCDSHQAL